MKDDFDNGMGLPDDEMSADPSATVTSTISVPASRASLTWVTRRRRGQPIERRRPRCGPRRPRKASAPKAGRGKAEGRRQAQGGREEEDAAARRRPRRKPAKKKPPARRPKGKAKGQEGSGEKVAKAGKKK